MCKRHNKKACAIVKISLTFSKIKLFTRNSTKL